MNTNEINKTNYYSEAVKKAQKKYYEKNKEIKLKCSLDRYNEKCKDNEEYKNKKNAYAKERYQKKKQEKQEQNKITV